MTSKRARVELSKATLRPTMFSYSGPDFVQDKPIMYRVEGVSAGYDIRIGTVKQRWHVLKRHGGAPSGWEGDFSSPEEALEAIRRELSQERPIPLSPSRATNASVPRAH
jgi:hypothetical protein